MEVRKILSRSVGQYRSLLQLLGKIEELPAEAADELALNAGCLRDLQADIEKTESHLSSLLQEGAKGEECSELLQERFRLMQEIAEQNRLLLPKFQGMMAVVSAELAELRSGRTALSGYRSGEPEKGERIRGAF